MPSFSNTQIPARALLRVLPLASALPDRGSRCPSFAGSSTYRQGRETARETARENRSPSLVLRADREAIARIRDDSRARSRNCSVQSTGVRLFGSSRMSRRLVRQRQVARVISDFTRGARSRLLPFKLGAEWSSVCAPIALPLFYSPLLDLNLLESRIGRLSVANFGVSDTFGSDRLAAAA